MLKESEYLGKEVADVRFSGIERRLEEIHRLLCDMRARYDVLLFGNGGRGLKERVSDLEAFRGVLYWVVPVFLGYMMFLTGVVLKDWVLWVFRR